MALINIICERMAHLAQIPLLKFLVNNMHHSLRNYRLLDLCRNEQFTTRCVGQETLRSNLATNFQERLDLELNPCQCNFFLFYDGTLTGW